MSNTHSDNEIEIWNVPVKAIVQHWNPFEAWNVPEIKQVEVKHALKTKQFDNRPYGSIQKISMTPYEERQYHIKRIAWLVENRDNNPIEIEIGTPSLGVYPQHGVFDFIDGNHRLCAAIIRNDDYIKLTYGGECDHFSEIFPDEILNFQDETTQKAY